MNSTPSPKAVLDFIYSLIDESYEEAFSYDYVDMTYAMPEAVNDVYIAAFKLIDDLASALEGP